MAPSYLKGGIPPCLQEKSIIAICATGSLEDPWLPRELAMPSSILSRLSNSMSSATSSLAAHGVSSSRLTSGLTPTLPLRAGVTLRLMSLLGASLSRHRHRHASGWVKGPAMSPGRVSCRVTRLDGVATRPSILGNCGLQVRSRMSRFCFCTWRSRSANRASAWSARSLQCLIFA